MTFICSNRACDYMIHLGYGQGIPALCPECGSRLIQSDHTESVEPNPNGYDFEDSNYRSSSSRKDE